MEPISIPPSARSAILTAARQNVQPLIAYLDTVPADQRRAVLGAAVNRYGKGDAITRVEHWAKVLQAQGASAQDALKEALAREFAANHLRDLGSMITPVDKLDGFFSDAWEGTKSVAKTVVGYAARAGQVITDIHARIACSDAVQMAAPVAVAAVGQAYGVPAPVGHAVGRQGAKDACRTNRAIADIHGRVARSMGVGGGGSKRPKRVPPIPGDVAQYVSPEEWAALSDADRQQVVAQVRAAVNLQRQQASQRRQQASQRRQQVAQRGRRTSPSHTPRVTRVTRVVRAKKSWLRWGIPVGVGVAGLGGLWWYAQKQKKGQSALEVAGG